MTPVRMNARQQAAIDHAAEALLSMTWDVVKAEDYSDVEPTEDGQTFARAAHAYSIALGNLLGAKVDIPGAEGHMFPSVAASATARFAGSVADTLQAMTGLSADQRAVLVSTYRAAILSAIGMAPLKRQERPVTHTRESMAQHVLDGAAGQPVDAIITGTTEALAILIGGGTEKLGRDLDGALETAEACFDLIRTHIASNFPKGYAERKAS
jgi:hypothetical protein